MIKNPKPSVIDKIKYLPNNEISSKIKQLINIMGTKNCLRLKTFLWIQHALVTSYLAHTPST